MLRHTFYTEVALQLPINTSSGTIDPQDEYERLHRLYWAAFNRAMGPVSPKSKQEVA